VRRIILQEQSHIHPFNEPARDLRVRNVPLWLWQRDLLTPHQSEEREYPGLEDARLALGEDERETLVHRDNMFFDRPFIEEFLQQARSMGRPAQAALKATDPAVVRHITPLTEMLRTQGDSIVADLWYLPRGLADLDLAEPLVLDPLSREVGYYHVPPYMAAVTGDLIFHLPRKALVSLESWVHIFVVDILFGVFSRGKDLEDGMSVDWRRRLKVLWRAIVEQRQVLDSSALVTVGRKCVIDPSAVIHGPTTIGNNVTIGPGTVIDNCVIGNNVNISQGCQLMLSVVGDGCFLPFRASLFMTTLMENSIVAQNACLQMCVIGRDTFIGAGTTFTDFRLLPGNLQARHGSGHLEPTDMYVLGGCAGHHCRLGSGLVIYPARTIESDVVLLPEDGNMVISRDVNYEDGASYGMAANDSYPRLYPRRAKDGRL
jgi:UDP-N-acetylglucosamine diphosphorylase / glucose-1-phosphate thymidylyltransferase / UDP-N-acetylgalactosamine diphosphorylase / glucosamine-1-phosphate N-acetyltransferase / galactosamine-1-phosphate N-acetyltransferase